MEKAHTQENPRRAGVSPATPNNFRRTKRKGETQMSKRFSYVKYDEQSAAAQETLKSHFEAVELLVDALPNSREKSLCLTALEEAYMWTGKAIRDAQIARGSMPEHTPERG